MLEEASNLKRSNYEPTYDLDGWNSFLAEIRADEGKWLEQRLAVHREVEGD